MITRLNDATTRLWSYICDVYDARWWTPDDKVYHQWLMGWEPMEADVRFLSTYQPSPNPLRYVACVLLALGAIRAPEGTTFAGHRWEWRFWIPCPEMPWDLRTLRQRLPFIWDRLLNRRPW